MDDELTGANHEGKVPVTVHCPACNVDVVIHVPEGHEDEKVRWEHACSNDSVYVGEWVNPDAVQSIAKPGPDDDVIWDGTRRAYVPRVVQGVTVSDGGSAIEGAATP